MSKYTYDISSVFYDTFVFIQIYEDDNLCSEFLIFQQDIPLVESILSDDKIAIFNLKHKDKSIKKLCRFKLKYYKEVDKR